MIYEPAEDTFLLAEAVKKYAKGNVLDMGTGSGYLAVLAAKKATSVLAVDKNKDAVSFCRKKYKQKNIVWKQSDFFSRVKGTFDTLIFNPPYLPYDKREPKESQQITTGGKHGYELLVRFLKECPPFLAEKGKILIVFSSLTKQQKIDQVIRESLLTKKVILTKHLPYEMLYVYLISKSPIRVALEKKGIKDLFFFAQGKRGMVYTGKYQGKRVAVKIHHPSSLAKSALAREAKMLPRVNKLGIGPDFLLRGKGYIVYVFVEGEQLRYVLPRLKKKQLIKIITDIFHQLYLLDNACIAKEEMNNPYKHIIITKSHKPVLLDFERAHRSKKRHNVTQFCSYLLRLRPLLEKKGIRIDQKEIIFWAKAYAKDPIQFPKHHELLHSYCKRI